MCVGSEGRIVQIHSFLKYVKLVVVCVWGGGILRVFCALQGKEKRLQ